MHTLFLKIYKVQGDIMEKPFTADKVQYSQLFMYEVGRCLLFYFFVFGVYQKNCDWV